MILDLSELKPAQVYFQMIQTLVPRPIAWVLSEIEQNKYNLAPFSYFNAVCSDPPLIMLSVGKKPDGSYTYVQYNAKDSDIAVCTFVKGKRTVLHRGEFD